MIFSKTTFGTRLFSIVKAFVLNTIKASCFSKVEPEDRLFEIIYEDRLFEVLPENRFIECPSVCAEDRIFKVEAKC